MTLFQFHWCPEQSHSSLLELVQKRAILFSRLKHLRMQCFISSEHRCDKAECGTLNYSLQYPTWRLHKETIEDIALKKLYSCVLFLTAIFFISSKEVSSCVPIIYENIFWKHETISTHMSLHCSFRKQFMKHCKKYTAKTWYIFNKNFGQQSGLNDLNPGTYRHYGDFFL